MLFYFVMTLLYVTAVTALMFNSWHGKYKYWNVSNKLCFLEYFSLPFANFLFWTPTNLSWAQDPPSSGSAEGAAPDSSLAQWQLSRYGTGGSVLLLGSATDQTVSQNVENNDPGRRGSPLGFVLYHIFSVLDRLLGWHSGGMRGIREIRRGDQLLSDRGESANVPAS